jgi:alkanesulfonate monooxygenase SsuD/methylene tetrahydromethanopterin reductase-like flavin-dependent oxidoreductase (luciferase family)
LFKENHFSLGIFSSNNKGGNCATTLPESWDPTWENCLALAKMADEAGLEILLPATRWIGWGGAGFQEEGIESMVWATALGQATKQIGVFATLHVQMYPPILAAKQMAAADRLLGGRFGLNIVCGWNRQEAEMFGAQVNEPGKQYEMAQEWLDIVRGYWRQDAKSEFNGEFYNLKNLDRGQGTPGSYDGDPVILNAAFSPKGREFAARNSDFLFSSPTTLESAASEVAEIKANARKGGKETGIIGTTHIICRPTRAEAEEYRRHVLDNADEEAVDNILRLFSIYQPLANAAAGGAGQGSTMTAEQYTAARNAMILGHGSFGLYGSPDDIADGYVRMAEAGYAGAVFTLTNYLDELPLIRDEVIPRLEARGVRQPVNHFALAE